MKIWRLLLVMAAALALSACADPFSQTTESTFYVMRIDCGGKSLSDACQVYPKARLLITASPVAQKVAWQQDHLDGTSETFSGTKCAVISGRNFSCNDLSLSDGLVSLYQPTPNPLFLDLSPDRTRINDHLVSWIMWQMSTEKNPAKVPLYLYKTLATGVASFTMVLIAVLMFVGGLTAINVKPRK